jgi:predicted transcriptional regulator of viral defense system
MNRIDEVVFKTLVPRSPVFTTKEVVTHAKIRLDVAARALSNLASRGLLTRVMRGMWADMRHPDFSPYAVVPHLLQGDEGYVSLLSALNLHGMIEQIPRAIHIVVDRQRRAIATNVGRYEFHKLSRELIGGHEPYGRLGRFELATPAKALFDTLYYSARKGRRFLRLPELELPPGFRRREVDLWIGRISDRTLRDGVKERWAAIPNA